MELETAVAVYCPQTPGKSDSELILQKDSLKKIAIPIARVVKTHEGR